MKAVYVLCVFKKQTVPFRLSSWREKERLLSESDSDIAVPVAAYHELPVVSSSTVDSISTETVVSQSGICQG